MAISGIIIFWSVTMILQAYWVSAKPGDFIGNSKHIHDSGFENGNPAVERRVKREGVGAEIIDPNIKQNLKQNADSIDSEEKSRQVRRLKKTQKKKSQKKNAAAAKQEKGSIYTSRLDYASYD